MHRVLVTKRPRDWISMGPLGNEEHPESHERCLEVPKRHTPYQYHHQTSQCNDHTQRHSRNKKNLQQLPKGPDNILTTTNIHPALNQNPLNLILWTNTYDKAVQVSLKNKPTVNTIQTSICQFLPVK